MEPHDCRHEAQAKAVASDMAIRSAAKESLCKPFQILLLHARPAV